MYARYECHCLVGTRMEAEFLVKLLTSWTVLLQGSSDSFDSVRELGRRIKVLPQKAAVYFGCKGGGVLLCSEGVFRVAIDCYDAARAGHLELEISVVWHCVQSSKRCSSEQCMVAAAEGDNVED